MNSRHVQIAAGIFGVTGVALGAFGAHGLRELLLEHGTTNAWETGARYHLLHAIALLALGFGLQQTHAGTPWLARAARAWIVGVVLFAGSLYALALGGPRWLGPITPLGGVCLLLGWLSVVIAGLKKES
jgi:uncharacterized membrane protein YgdD (TMEM256/DUF423 family)